MNQRVRAKVVVPAVCILLLFLGGFPVWLRAPQSLAGRAFSWFFGAILCFFVLMYVIGTIASWIGPFFGFSPLRELWSDVTDRRNKG